MSNITGFSRNSHFYDEAFSTDSYDCQWSNDDFLKVSQAK